MKKMPSSAFKLAWRELRHGWKHFAVFIACLILGVTVMATVSSFAYIVKNSLQSEAKSLLGGDMEISIRGLEATKAEENYIRQYGQTSYVTTLRSMLYAGEQNTLVELKAVDNAYPLLGNLEFNEDVSREQVFADNGIAVDSILLSQLGLKLGDTVRIGNASFTIRATLKNEPDRVVQIFTFGPRVMMSHSALEGTGLVNPFSLIENRYRVLTPANITVNKAYEGRVEKELAAKFPNTSWRVSTATDGNQLVQRFIDQLISFLNLSALSTFLIAGIGIGSAVRAYLEKKSQTIAMFKVLGADRRTILETYVMVLGILAFVGGVAGIAISAAVTKAALPLVAEVLPSLAKHGELSPIPLVLSLWYGVLISYLFSMPALLSALNIRPSLLFRSKTSVLSFRTDRMVQCVMVVLIALLLATLLLTAQDITFMLGAVAVMFVTFALFGLCTLAVKSVAKRIHVRKPWMKLALGNLYRPGATTGTVIFAIGISLTVLITLTLTEANFRARIVKLVKEEAPTLFMIDIQPQQRLGLHNLLNEYASDEHIVMYPMVRGRITKKNGQLIREQDVGDEIRWAVRGDRGLSYSTKPPKNAHLIEGKWWPENYHGKPLVSVDDRFLSGMNLKIGDTLTLNVLGEDIVATVANARDIDYTTFQINFALMLSPGVLEKFPQTYLATIHLGNHADKEAELVKKIAKQFPGVTIIRTTEVVNLVRDVMQHIATALRITVAISLLAGFLVLTSALSATLEQRLYDTAILKVLGARRRDILKSCTAEWMLLAIITALIAAVIGTFSSYLVLMRLRGQTFALMPEVTLITIFSCIVVIWITGYFGNRRLFSLKPASLLRNE